MKTASTTFLPVLATMLLSVCITLSARADRAENAFVKVRAVGAGVTRVDGRNFSAQGDTEVEIEAQPGWTLLTPSRVRVTKGQSPRYRVKSASGEDDGQGDLWWMVVEVVTNHLTDPVIAASVSAGGPYVYALPDDGADAATTFTASATKLGTHEIETRTTTYHNGTVVDESVEKSEPFTLDIDRWSWDWVFDDSGTTNRQAFTTPVQHLANGTHAASGTVEGRCSLCASCSGTASASTNVIVSLLKVSCNPWIGQDRTGDPSTPYTSPKVTATAALDPENPDVKKVAWGGENKCEKRESHDWSITLWTEDRDKASDTYLGEKVTATACGATATTNFTIVKVDVILAGKEEQAEEQIGADVGIKNAPPEEYEQRLFWTLPNIDIVIKPEDIPSESIVVSSCSSEAKVYAPLTINGFSSLQQVALPRTVGEALNMEICYLCGAVHSTVKNGGVLSLLHEESGAFDSALFTVYEITSTTISQIPANRSRTKIGVGEEVSLTVLPTTIVSWKSTKPTLSPSVGATSSYAAGDESGLVEISATTSSGAEMNKMFQIVPPSGIESAQLRTNQSFPSGIQAVWLHFLPVVVGPTDVSFYNVQFLEVGENASGLTGYYLTNPQDAPSHIGSGADTWFQLDNRNRWPSNWDFAGLRYANPILNAQGSFVWNIPGKWRLLHGNEHEVDKGWSQRFVLYTNGTLKIEKFGLWGSRSISNERHDGAN